MSHKLVNKTTFTEKRSRTGRRWNLPCFQGEIKHWEKEHRYKKRREEEALFREQERAQHAVETRGGGEKRKTSGP